MNNAGLVGDIANPAPSSLELRGWMMTMMKRSEEADIPTQGSTTASTTTQDTTNNDNSTQNTTTETASTSDTSAGWGGRGWASTSTSTTTTTTTTTGTTTTWSTAGSGSVGTGSTWTGSTTTWSTAGTGDAGTGTTTTGTTIVISNNWDLLTVDSLSLGSSSSVYFSGSDNFKYSVDLNYIIRNDSTWILYFYYDQYLADWELDIFTMSNASWSLNSHGFFAAAWDDTEIDAIANIFAIQATDPLVNCAGITMTGDAGSEIAVLEAGQSCQTSRNLYAKVGTGTYTIGLTPSGKGELNSSFSTP